MLSIKRVATSSFLIEDLIGTGGLVILTTCVVLIAFLRYVFSYAILGLEEATVVVALWIYLMGSAWASRNEAQIRVTIIDIIPIKLKVRQVIDIFGLIVSIIICSMFSYFSFRYAQWALINNVTTPPLMWSQSIIASSIPVGAGLMAVHYVQQLVQRLGELRASNHRIK